MGNLNHLHKKAHYEQPRANSVVYNVLNCGHRSKSYIKRIIIQKNFYNSICFIKLVFAPLLFLCNFYNENYDKEESTEFIY
jgi:hypothetical protein